MSEIKNLQTLINLEKYQNYRLVAERMGISQPAVTKRMRALEATFGTKLIKQKGKGEGKGVELTAHARAIIDDAKEIIISYEKLLKNSVPSSEFSGIISLGVVEVILRAWFPDFIALMADHYPNIELDIYTQSSKNLEADLLNKRLDIALMLPSPKLRHFKQYPTGRMRMNFFASQKQKLPPQAIFNKSDVRRFISLPEGTKPYFDLVETLHRSYEFNSTPIISVESFSEVFLMAELGLGIGVAPIIIRPDSKVNQVTIGEDIAPLDFVAAFLKVRENKQFSAICAIAEQASKDFAQRNPKECQF